MNFKKVTSLLMSILITISVLSGCSSKLTFKQDDLVTRIEYAQLLFEKFYDKDDLKSKEKTIEELSENQMPYADVSADSGNYLYATLLFENCLIQDDELENNMLKPDEYITRETAVSWAVRMIGLSTDEIFDIPGIKDNSYLIDIYTAISNDIISVESEFYPDDNPNYSELVDILNNSYNLYLELNQVEEQYYNIEYAPSVKQITYDNTKNIITENNDYSCVLSNISDDMKNLSYGTVVAIIDENNMHNNFIFKVESATYSENAVTIQKNNNIDIDEIVTDLNFNTSCIITAEDIDSSQLPEGVTLIEDDPNYTASKKYLGKGSVSELSSGKKFKIKRRINDVVMLEGSFGLALGFSKVKYDKKKDQLILKKEESYSLDLKVTASTDNVDKDLNGEFKWPLIPPLVFPTGVGDVVMDINTYLYGKIGGEIDVKGTLSYETGYIYKNKKISTIKKCIEKDFDIIPKEYDLEKKLNVFAEIGVLVDAKACFLADTVHAGADFSGGARTEVDILDGLSHSCYSCYDGNIKLVGKIEPELSFGIGDDFRVDALKDVELLKIKIPLFDFYSSKKDAGENRKFGWGDCPNKQQKDTGEKVLRDDFKFGGYNRNVEIGDKIIEQTQDGIIVKNPDGSNEQFILYGSEYAHDFVTDGETLYYYDSKDVKIKKFDIESNTSEDVAEVYRDKALVASMYDQWGDHENYYSYEDIYNGGSIYTYLNGVLYFCEYYTYFDNPKIYTLNLTTNEYKEISYFVGGENIQTYKNKFYYTGFGHEEMPSTLYEMNADGTGKKIILENVSNYNFGIKENKLYYKQYNQYEFFNRSEVKLSLNYYDLDSGEIVILKDNLTESEYRQYEFIENEYRDIIEIVEALKLD